MNYCPFCSRLLARVGPDEASAFEYQCRQCLVSLVGTYPDEEPKPGVICVKPIHQTDLVPLLRPAR
jgi:hypothetical protein